MASLNTFCTIAARGVPAIPGGICPTPLDKPELRSASSMFASPGGIVLDATAAATSDCPTDEMIATRTAPMIAIPNEEPTCLTVLFAPDPIPAFCQGILISTTLVTWLIANPTPAP